MSSSLLTLVRAGAAVSWGNAWLAGLTSLDEAAERITGDDQPHLLVDLPGEAVAVSWPVALGRLRAAGATRLQLALPVAGDPLGLGGPVDLNADAVATGAAVMAVAAGSSYALLPGAPDGRRPVRWTVRPAGAPPPPPDPGQARRDLSATMHGTTRALELLDVARREAGAEIALADADRLLADRPAAHLSRRDTELLATAARLLVAVEQALRGAGGSVSATEAAVRHQALLPVAAAARRALVAVYSAPLGSTRPR